VSALHPFKPPLSLYLQASKSKYFFSVTMLSFGRIVS
jgi:hypothetical protein